MIERFGVAMLGFGVVGGGVGRILNRQRDWLANRTGLAFDVKHVVVRDTSRVREDLPPGTQLTSDIAAAINDPDVHIIVELMGGLDVAGEAIRMALQAGKHVVTANKSLLAQDGSELFAMARENNSVIAFEASVAGGIPIINAMLHGLSANRVHAIVGIINGTCNFILTQMTRQRTSYAEALAKAQAAGFAEADPTLDVSGRDAAQKLALIASLAFNARLLESHVYVEGIEQLEPTDIVSADELGYVIKLLAIAEADDAGRVCLRVHPTLVPSDDVLADVSGSFNAVAVWGDALGHSLYYGRGAGKMPTASAVVADLINVASGSALNAFNHMRVFPDRTAEPKLMPLAEAQTRFYLRLNAKDEPGVLAQVATLLAENDISIASVLQHEDRVQTVPVIITTHRAPEGAMRKALEKIRTLPVLETPPICLRMLEATEERI